MNNDSFLIEEFDLDIAKDICKFIDNADLRNQAAANVTAAKLAQKYFQDCEIDTESGLHNISQVLEDINIADIYIKDNYIDVRLYFNDNELFVPKEHFDSKLLPVAYMFIKVSSDLSNGLVTGFITPALIKTDNEVNGYYHVNEDELISFYDVESGLINKFSDDLPDNFESLIFDYLDNKLEDKQSFFKILLDSEDARIKLQQAAKAKTVFDFISIPVSDAAEIEEVESEDAEVLSESFDLLEEANSDFSLEEDSSLAGFDEIEEVESLVLEEADTLSLDNNDSINLDIDEAEEAIEPFETEPITEQMEQEEQDFVSVSEEEPFELNSSFDADSIQMLGAEEYEELTVPEITEDDIQADSIEEVPSFETQEETDVIEDTTKIEIEGESTASLDIVNETEVETKDTLNEVSDFNFSTNTTPSLDTFDKEEKSDFSEDLLNSLETEEPAEEPAVQDILEEETPVTESEVEEQENSEQIDALFNPEEAQQEVIPVEKPKSKNVLLPFIAVVAVLGAVGYFGYTKFMTQQPAVTDMIDNSQNAIQPVEPTEAAHPAEDAMPVETVENVKLQLNTNEGNTVSIPAIEQNLDASITVSNLHVEFEIPAGYKASKTAERYFTKMGKIIQLNLKTELLLLTKQPITNKIAVELEFDKTSQKFGVKGIVASSGEQSIDDLIVSTIKNALNINLNMNMGIFGNVAGNPILVIKL